MQEFDDELLDDTERPMISSESLVATQKSESDSQFKRAVELSKNVFVSRELNHLDGKEIAM